MISMSSGYLPLTDGRLFLSLVTYGQALGIATTFPSESDISSKLMIKLTALSGYYAIACYGTVIANRADQDLSHILKHITNFGEAEEEEEEDGEEEEEEEEEEEVEVIAVVEVEAVVRSNMAALVWDSVLESCDVQSSTCSHIFSNEITLWRCLKQHQPMFFAGWSCCEQRGSGGHGPWYPTAPAWTIADVHGGAFALWPSQVRKPSKWPTLADLRLSKVII